MNTAQDNMAEPPVPSSWNYGSFHLHSRLYTSFVQKEGDRSAVLAPKYEPLSNTTKVDPKAGYRLPPHGQVQRRASREEYKRRNLQVDNVKPRKVSTSTGWQRTAKSVE